jgi:anti-anti-sigma factor
MKLNVRQVGHVAVVDLAGKITVGEGDAVLREGVFKLLQSDQRQILLNLGKVPYIDSSGIGEMVACYKAARDKNGTGPIPKGTRVRVVQVHDMRLTVEPLEARGNEPEEGREE